MSKLRRFLIAFDNHGDMADPAAVNAFKDFARYWKPTIRIHGGDAFDLRAMRGGASKDERLEGVKADVEAGLDFLTWFQPQVFLMGNHDHRLHRIIQNSRDDNLRNYCALLLDSIIDTLGVKCKIIPWGKSNHHQLGDYKVIHGYHSGLYAARQAAQIYGNVIMGHVHTPGYYEAPHIDGQTGYTSGSLCRLEMDYNAGHPNTLRQAHGWIYGLLKGKKATPFAARQLAGGGWFLPTEWREVA